MCAAAALYVFNVLRDCNIIMKNKNDKMFDKKDSTLKNVPTFKKCFLRGIGIGWLLFGHLGREKEYVAIIISLTTPEGKSLMMLLCIKQIANIVIQCNGG